MKILCGVAWSVQSSLALALLFLVGLLFLSGAVRRVGRRAGAIICAASVAAFLFQLWFSATPICRLGRVARKLVSLDYASVPFECEAPSKSLQGVSKDEATQALDDCDEDQWDTVWTGRDAAGVKHTIMRCRGSANVEIWGDHFRYWNRQGDWDVCFSACRPGTCSAKSVMVEHTES